MKNLVIKRSSWLRGSSWDFSCLLNGEGKKCCLGFLALDCGLEEKDILNRSTPRRAKNNHLFPDQLIFGGWDSSYADRLMKINDDSSTSDQEKEDSLIKEFKKMDYNLSFEE